jgi:hypothetical protein
LDKWGQEELELMIEIKELIFPGLRIMAAI